MAELYGKAAWLIILVSDCSDGMSQRPARKPAMYLCVGLVAWCILTWRPGFTVFLLLPCHLALLRGVRLLLRLFRGVWKNFLTYLSVPGHSRLKMPQQSRQYAYCQCLTCARAMMQICAYTILDVISKVVVSFMVMSGHDILREGPAGTKDFF